MSLKIGTVSKLTGFSASGIRYYEERGIVTPSHGRDGTYRSFDLPDVSRLLECRNYRECGCDTEEIAGLVSDGTRDDVMAALESCEARAREEVERAQRLEAFLAHRTAVMREIVGGNLAPRVARSPATYWAPLWMPGSCDGVEPRIPTGEEGFPIPYADSSLLLDEECFDAASSLVGVSVGYAVARAYVTAAPRADDVVFLPAARCVRAPLRVGDDFSPCAEDVAAVRAFLRAERLAVAGRAFTHRVCTVYGERGLRFDEMWVPVRPTAADAC